MAILDFPNTGLYPGYQWTGDNGTTYVYDGVKWVGRAVAQPAGTSSITNNGFTLQIGGDGNLIIPTGSHIYYQDGTLLQDAQGPQGIPGAKGDKGDNGNPGVRGATGQGFNFRGAWADGIYSPYDVVTYQGSSYVCILGHVTGQSNPTDTTHYTKIADKGAAGTNGAPGAKGADGAPGRDGLNGLNGTNGTNGTPGRDGTNGAPGTNGLNGTNGLPGTNGSKGDKGDTGAQGVSVTLQGTKATIADLPAAPLDPNDFAGHAWIVTTGDVGTGHLNGSLWFWNLTEQAWNDIGQIQGPQGDKGDSGDKGDRGFTGENGQNGLDGRSAYELAQDGGFEGTQAEWLQSLVGATGSNGADGQNGQNGLDGRSAYELAQAGGFEGTQEEWLLSLVGPEGQKGEQGEPGVSADQLLNTTNSVRFNDLTLTNGDDRNGSNGFTQITLGYGGAAEFPHFIRTRHDDSILNNNAIDFYTNANQSSGDNNPTLGLTIANGKLIIPGYIDAQQGNDLNLRVFNPTVEGQPGGVTLVLSNRDVNTGGRNTQVDVAPTNITLTTDFDNNQYQWKFDNTGAIILPGDTAELYTPSEGEGNKNIDIYTNWYGEGSVEVWLQHGNKVSITTNQGANEWAFDADGVLHVPGYIQHSTTLNYLHLADSNDEISLVSEGNNAVNIKVNTNNNNVIWTFGTDGILTIPTGGDIIRDGVSAFAGGSSGTVWTNDANGCLRAELSSTGFQAFTAGTHLDLQDSGVWNVGSYQHGTSIGNDGFANPNDLSLRASDAVFINTDTTQGYDSQWMFSNKILQLPTDGDIVRWNGSEMVSVLGGNGGPTNEIRSGSQYLSIANDGKLTFTGTQFDTGPNTLEFTTGGMFLNGGSNSEVFIDSDNGIVLENYNPNFVPVTGQVFSSLVSVGQAFGFEEILGTDYVGPAMTVGTAVDHRDGLAEMIGMWTVDKNGNLVTAKATVWYDINEQTLTDISTGDITDKDGNSLIYVPASDTAPSHNIDGLLWYNSDEGRTYIKYNGQWVDASPTVLPLPVDVTQLANGDNSLTLGSDGILTFGSVYNNVGMEIKGAGGNTILGYPTLLDLTADDQTPWALTIRNRLAGLDKGLEFFVADNGDGYIINNITELALQQDGILRLGTNPNRARMLIGELADGDAVLWAQPGLDTEYLGLWWAGNTNYNQSGYGPDAGIIIGTSDWDDSQEDVDPETQVNIGIGQLSWKFDATGNLTLPENGDIKNSNGDSVLGGAMALIDGGAATTWLTPV